MTEGFTYEIESVTVQLEKAKRTPDYTLFLEKEDGKKYVLSKYDPKSDIQKRLENKLSNKETLFIIVGFVYGYMLEFLEQKLGSDFTAIVIEPDEKVLKKQLELKEDFEFSRYPNVKVFCGTNFEEFSELVRQVMGIGNANNIEPIFMDAYDWAYPCYYKEILNRLIDIRHGLLINQNTFKEFGSLWVRNIVENRHYINSSCNIEKLKDKFTDIPAVIVSGGPSLDKNIQYIKDFKGIIFTGGRTVAPVLRYGAPPDFVCSLDPQDATLDTFLEYGKNELPLITTTTSSSKVIKNNTGPQYFVTNDGFAQCLIGTDGSFFEMGGSVATLCLSSAVYMGCNPIIFIGQDLAPPPGPPPPPPPPPVTSYAKDGKRGHKKVKGYYGDEVVSDAGLIGFLRWIEAFIERHSDKVFLNATEGGALIKGTENCPFEEVTKKDNSITKPQILHEKKEESVNVDENICEALAMLKEINELAQKCNNILKAIKVEFSKYRGNRERKIFLLIEQFKKIDTNILKYQEKLEIVSTIFQGKTNAINMDLKYKEKVNETELESNIRTISKEHDIYLAFRDSVQEIINAIEETLKEK